MDNLDFSNIEEYKFDKIKYDKRLIIYPSNYTRPEKERIDLVIDKIVYGTLTERALKLVWWVITHPEKDLKFINYCTIIIGALMGDIFKDWKTTVPSLIAGILGLLSLVGIPIPPAISSVASGAIIALILLFVDWNEFKKNFTALFASVGTFVFGILNWAHLIVMPEATTNAIINFLIMIIGSLFVKSTVSPPATIPYKLTMIPHETKSDTIKEAKKTL